MVVIYEAKSYVSDRISPEGKKFWYILEKTRRGGSKRGICGHYSTGTDESYEGRKSSSHDSPTPENSKKIIDL